MNDKRPIAKNELQLAITGKIGDCIISADLNGIVLIEMLNQSSKLAKDSQ